MATAGEPSPNFLFNEPASPIFYTPETSGDEQELAPPIWHAQNSIGFEGGEKHLEEERNDHDSHSDVKIAATSKFTLEGLNLVKGIWNTFWDQDRMHFRATVKSAETISDWNGYPCWPYTIALEAILEAERAAPGQFREQALIALIGLEKYYSAEHGGYCAWIWFQGNEDIYIDDNAQVAILLALAHRLLPPPKADSGLPYPSYLSRAKEIVSFCASAWDEKSGGGIRWHLSTQGPPSTNRNACSTSLTAVAALEVARILKKQRHTGKEFQNLVALGKKCLYWVVDNLVSKTNTTDTDYWLVRDGLVHDFHGPGGLEWRVEETTYTYNTGHTITGLVHLHELVYKEEQTDISTATSLAMSAVDRRRSLYDLTVSDPACRYWWDNNFFVHLLVEGLVTWGERFGGLGCQSSLWAKVSGEVKRQMEYVVEFLKDPVDDLYFRNFRLYTITHDHLVIYKLISGDNGRRPRYDGAERRMDDQSMKLPVEKRATTKTLLGCAGAARALLIAGRLK